MLIKSGLLLALLAYSATGEVPPSFPELSRAADEARDAHRLEEAVGLYAKALKLLPTWADGWWSLGSIAYDRDDFAKCAPAFQKLTALKPDSAPAWTMAGLCQYKLRSFVPALDSLTHAERLQFQEPAELSRAARLHLALVLMKTGSFERAIVVLTALTRFDRKAPDISVAAGIAGLREPWLPSEVPQEKRGLVMKLGDAMSAAMEQDVQTSIQKFELVVHEFPNEPNVHFRFGAFLAMQQPDRGIEEIKAALQLDPSHVPALVGLTTIYLKRDDFETALQYSERGVQAGPADFSTHLAYGRVLQAVERPAAAVPELERAVALAPESPEARYSLASAYTSLGRKRDAQREQEEFKRLTKLINSVQP